MGFTVVGSNTVTFTPYADWAKTTVNGSEQYWIRSRVSVAAFTTQPLLTQGWVIVPDALVYTDTNLGMYSFENTAALYCLICGKSIDWSGNGDASQYFYNTCLLGKTIYNHVAHYGGWHYSQYTYPQMYESGFIVNNNYIYKDDTEQQDRWSNGYYVTNIETIDGAIGIQNIFEYHKNTTSGGAQLQLRYSFASVLITS